MSYRKISNQEKNNIVKEILDYEKKVAENYGIDSSIIQQFKREHFLNNSSYSFEFEKLQGTMLNLQILKPLLHMKIYHTGMLFQTLASALKEYNGYVINEEYILASYYCNFGFLSIENSIYRNNYTTSEDRKIIERHIKISADLLNEKGMSRVANIVRLHHEKPNGSGYLREQNHDDKLLALINIADEYIDVVLPSKRPEVMMVPEEAIEHAFKGYETHLLIPIEELKIKEYGKK